MKRILLLISILWYFPLLVVGQKEAVNWYFGQNAGVNFNTGDPINQIGALKTWGGSACISDTNGQILFYTNGEEVFNKDHVLMQNGDLLNGSQYAIQPAVIIPMPLSDSKYYCNHAFPNTLQWQALLFQWQVPWIVLLPS